MYPTPSCGPIHRPSMHSAIPFPTRSRTMARPPHDPRPGALASLVLKTVSWGPAHGYAIARWIQQLTGQVLEVGEGSLYPALHRLEERGLVKSEWQLSPNNRRARFYQITT